MYCIRFSSLCHLYSINDKGQSTTTVNNNQSHSFPTPLVTRYYRHSTTRQTRQSHHNRSTSTFNHRKTHSKCSPTVLPSSPPFSPFLASQTLLTPLPDSTDDITVSPPGTKHPLEVSRRSRLELTLVIPKPRGPSSVRSRRGVLSNNVGSEALLRPHLRPLPPAPFLASRPTAPFHLPPLLLLPLLRKPLQSPIRTLGQTK